MGETGQWGRAGPPQEKRPAGVTLGAFCPPRQSGRYVARGGNTRLGGERPSLLNPLSAPCKPLPRHLCSQSCSRCELRLGSHRCVWV